MRDRKANSQLRVVCSKINFPDPRGLSHSQTHRRNISKHKICTRSRQSNINMDGWDVQSSSLGAIGKWYLLGDEELGFFRDMGPEKLLMVQ